MKRLWMTLALLVIAAPDGARAEDETIGQKADRATEAVETAASSARARASDAVEKARTRADEVAQTAREKTRSAAESLSSRAREAAERAEELASEVAGNAKDRAEQLGERVGDALTTSKDTAADLLTSARNEARDVLMGLADMLDGASREAREALRREHWEKLRQRFSFGNKPSAAISDELLDHEYRVARLKRARELAKDAEDERAVAKANRLLESEYARHKQKLEQLRDDARREAKR